MYEGIEKEEEATTTTTTMRKSVHRPSNALDMTQPLLYHRLRESGVDATKVFFPDTVDFGVDSTDNETECYSYGSSSPIMGPAPTIDNTTLVYIPVRLPCGIQVQCAPEVLSGCPMVLRSLQTDLTQIFQVLPWSVHNLVKRTTIWVNASYCYGSRDDPRVLRHSTAHHEEGWLIHCARDRPEKARSVEIYSCYDFERMRLHWNGCGLLLHELCHLIHQFCFGLEDEGIEGLYEQARTSGLYDQTLRRDWAGYIEEDDMAYAMVDHKEFFAEMSVTYLSNGYSELDYASKTDMEECSPPLLQPNVTDRVLQKHGILEEPFEYPPSQSTVPSFLSSLSLLGIGAGKPKPKLRIVDPIMQEDAIGRSCLGVTHCNKFYPFTRGQLQYHDPTIFHQIHDLWVEIAMWDDPEDDRSSCRSLRRWLPRFG